MLHATNGDRVAIGYTSKKLTTKMLTQYSNTNIYSPYVGIRKPVNAKETASLVKFRTVNLEIYICGRMRCQRASHT